MPPRVIRVSIFSWAIFHIITSHFLAIKIWKFRLSRLSFISDAIHSSGFLLFPNKNSRRHKLFLSLAENCNSMSDHQTYTKELKTGKFRTIFIFPVGKICCQNIQLQFCWELFENRSSFLSRDSSLFSFISIYTIPIQCILFDLPINIKSIFLLYLWFSSRIIIEFHL